VSFKEEAERLIAAIDEELLLEEGSRPTAASTVSLEYARAGVVRIRQAVARQIAPPALLHSNICHFVADEWNVRSQLGNDLCAFEHSFHEWAQRRSRE
jgi:hypothetical protein